VANFLGSFFITTGILLVLSTPVFYLGWRKGRHRTVRRFLSAAGATGLIASAIATNSERLVAQCEAADYLNCLDIGSAGIRFLFIVAYVIVAWVKALMLFRE
jgi:hypothetical protein